MPTADVHNLESQMKRVGLAAHGKNYNHVVSKNNNTTLLLVTKVRTSAEWLSWKLTDVNL